MFQDYLFHFYAPLPCIELTCPENSSPKNLCKNIEALSKKHSVSAFIITIDSTPDNLFSDINIYCTDSSVRKTLKEDFQIVQKRYDSIFFTTSDVAFHEMKEFPVKNCTSIKFSLIGSSKNIENFCEELSEEYECGDLQPGRTMNQEKNILYVSWIIVTVLAFLLTWYEVLLRKKENGIKISLGEKVGSIVLKNTLTDVACYSVAAIAIVGLLLLFTNTMFLWQISLKMFAVMLLVSTLPYLSLYRYKLKEAFSGINESVSLLSASYGLKLVTAVLTILIISSNFMLISEAYTYYTQKDFFRSHSDYSFINVNYNQKGKDNDSMDNFLISQNKSAVFQYNLYKKCFSDKNVIMLLANKELEMPSGENKELIQINKNGKDYLLGHIKGIEAEKISENKIYYLFPEGDYDRNMLEVQIKDIKEYIAIYYGYDYDFEVQFYKSSSKMIGIFNNKSTYYKNAVIIFSNLDESLMQIEHEELVTHDVINNEDGSSDSKCEGMIINCFQDGVMYRISDTEIEKFAEQNGYDIDNYRCSRLNVYESFLNHWNTLKQSLYINCILSALIIALEMIVISTIIKIEYSVNAMELAIKKVLGYSIWQRNKKIFIITFSVIVAGIAAALVVNAKFNISQALFVIAGGVVMAVLESIVILYFVRKMEHVRIQKILKGGAL
jgi:hypothetical protein